MKCYIFLCLLGLLALTSAGHGDKESDHESADKDFLRKYKLVLQLFDHVNQPSFFKEVQDAAEEFDFNKYKSHFKKPEAVDQYVLVHEKKALPKGKIFSVLDQEQLEEVHALFRVFYYAKDFETFHRVACWARQNVNEGVFLYTFSVALVQRTDCKGLNLPPIYEIYPHYFFSSEVIEQASIYKQKHHGEVKHEGEFSGYTIDANYSGYYLNLHPEQSSLSYILEDVGWNAIEYLYNVYYPYWLSGTDGEVTAEMFYRRGEIFYNYGQQLLARYYMERLSNNLGRIQELEFDLPFEIGYYPSLRYPNGLEFPKRPNFANLKEYLYQYGQNQCTSEEYLNSYVYVQDYLRRIRDVIDKGTLQGYTKNAEEMNLITEDGVNVLGNIIEGNGDSPNLPYFGNVQKYARYLLGYSYLPKSKNHLAPSALEHFETCLRDPAYYQLHKKLYHFIEQYKNYLPKYKKEDLIFPGVSVTKVEFDKLITFFDYFYSDISNAVYVTPEEAKTGSFKVRAKQPRLNHEPFSYKIYIDADKKQEVSVRTYLAPKYDEFGRTIDMKENRFNFVHFDFFTYNVTAGKNVIDRKYEQFFSYCADPMPYRELYEKVSAAEAGKAEFDPHTQLFCFPRRWIIPKGSPSGTPYMVYILVSPYKKNDDVVPLDDAQRYTVHNMDEYPLGYPFDRELEHDEHYTVPNAYLYDTKIYYEDSIREHKH